MRKDLWKNPDTYFVILPILAGLWALAAGLAFYPKSVRAWEEEKDLYAEAEILIGEILQMEPERLEFQQQKGTSSEFDYVTEIDRFAKEFGIPTGDYTLTVRQGRRQRGSMRKSADLAFKSVKVETLAGFISAMLFRWPELQCEQVTLDKVPAAKNEWKVKLRFTYYY